MDIFAMTVLAGVISGLITAGIVKLISYLISL